MNLINFRDLGGYTTEHGLQIKYKKVLRSGELYQLDEQSKDILLNQYHLKQVVDFRSLAEINKRPDDALSGVQFYIIDLLKQLAGGSSLEDLSQITDCHLVDRYMLHVYEQLILDDVAQAGYYQFFQKLLNLPEDESLLFHCFAGKDRTGIAAALFLAYLGVSQDDIFKDYLATNVQRHSANELILQGLKEKGATQENLEAMRIALNVKASYLTQAFDVIEKNFGNIQQYAKEILKLTDEDYNIFKIKYLQEAEVIQK